MGGGRWLAQAGSRAAVGLALICWLLAPAGGAAPSREWEEGVQAARREGRLVVYDAFGGAVPTVQYAAERFEATHRVKVEIAVMRASESIERIRVEQRAGRAVADLVTAGSGTTRPMLDEGVLRPFERLPSAPRIAPQVRLKVQEWELQQYLLPFLIQLY
jgi:maltose-binding protein MalE